MTSIGAARTAATLAVRLVVQSGSSLLVLLINGLFGQASVALYSVAFAAIALIVIVFQNGLPVLLLRTFVNRKEACGKDIYRGFQATQLRSPAQFSKAFALVLAAVLYLSLTIGREAVSFFLLLSPILLLMPMAVLRSAFHKAMGQSVRASLCEAGWIHIALSGLVLVAVWFGAPNLQTAFVYGFPIFAVTAAVLVLRTLKATRSTGRITDRVAQRTLLANALLTFVFRNGFPLVFAAFMATEDLGRFRVEERLFFLLMFLYFLFEAVSANQLITVFRDKATSHRLRVYFRMAGIVFGFGLVSALAMVTLLSYEPLANWISYSWHGDWTILMALSIPFYILALFNNLILNLVGQHGSVTRSMLAGAVVFLLGTFLIYSNLGIDGIRLAYFGGGLASAFLSTVSVLAGQYKTI